MRGSSIKKRALSQELVRAVSCATTEAGPRTKAGAEQRAVGHRHDVLRAEVFRLRQNDLVRSLTLVSFSGFVEEMRRRAPL